MHNSRDNTAETALYSQRLRLRGVTWSRLARGIVAGVLLLPFSAPLYAAEEKPAKDETVTVAPVQVAPADSLATKPAKLEHHFDKDARIKVDSAQLQEGTSCVSMQLTNEGKMMDSLVAVSTPIGKAVMISQFMHRDVERIEIYTEKPTVLKPGEQCVVVRGIKTPLKAGDKFDLTLSFDRAAEKTVSVSVISAEQALSYIPKVEHKAAKHDKDHDAKEAQKAQPEKSAPVDAKPVEEKPAEVKPAETKPVEVKPVEEKPAPAPAATKPLEAKKEEVKPSAPVAPAKGDKP